MGLLFYILNGGLARVWFGADDLPAFWQNRGVQTFYMLFLFMSIYFPRPFSWVGLVIAVILTCWLQFQYWSRGHGVAIDTGDDKNPSASTIKRYNERWYALVCDWLFEKVFKQPDRKYGYLYDFIYLTLRYTCPMIVVSIFLQVLSWFGLAELNWWYIVLGLTIAPVYVFSNELQEHEPWVFEANKWYWRRGWSLAEILSGAVTYGGCYLLW